MKRSSSVPWLIALILLIILVWRELSRGGGIPVDKERVKEHVITMKEANEYATAFASAKAELKRQIQDTGYLDRNFNMPVCELFNRDAIAALLNKKGADGVRIYLGLNPKKEVVFVLVPVDGRGKDISGKLLAYETPWIPGISTAVAAPPDEDAEALERGQRCPYNCDATSPVTEP
ncbi:hypothetical protein ACWKWU_20670 [Chitinophaga lutea]